MKIKIINILTYVEKVIYLSIQKAVEESDQEALKREKRLLQPRKCIYNVQCSLCQHLQRSVFLMSAFTTFSVPYVSIYNVQCSLCRHCYTRSANYGLKILLNKIYNVQCSLCQHCYTRTANYGLKILPNKICIVIYTITYRVQNTQYYTLSISTVLVEQSLIFPICMGHIGRGVRESIPYTFYVNCVSGTKLEFLPNAWSILVAWLRSQYLDTEIDGLTLCYINKLIPSANHSSALLQSTLLTNEYQVGAPL